MTRSSNPVTRAPADTNRPVSDADAYEAAIDAMFAELEHPENAVIPPPKLRSRAPIFATRQAPVSECSIANKAASGAAISHSEAISDGSDPIVHIPISISNSNSSTLPSSTTRNRISKQLLDLIAKAKAKYASSESYKQGQITRRANREAAARALEEEFAKQARTPWEKLKPLAKLYEDLDHLVSTGRSCDFTFLLGEHALEILRSKPEAVQRTWFVNRIKEPLEKALGRQIKFALALQVNKAGYQHAHGFGDFTEAELPVVKQILGRPDVLGLWRAGRTGEQFQIRPTPDRGWIGYSLREIEKLTRGDFYVSRPLTQAARAHHAARKQAAKEGRSGILVPVSGSAISDDRLGDGLDEFVEVQLRPLGMDSLGDDVDVDGIGAGERLQGTGDRSAGLFHGNTTECKSEGARIFAHTTGSSRVAFGQLRLGSPAHPRADSEKAQDGDLALPSPSLPRPPRSPSASSAVTPACARRSSARVS